MLHPSSSTARTHAHTSISTLKSVVNFCSRDFLFHKEFDDSTLAKPHIVVGHFVRSDTSHMMQAIDVTGHSRITQQLVPSTTALSFVCYSQFVHKKMLLMTLGTSLVQMSSQHLHLKQSFLLAVLTSIMRTFLTSPIHTTHITRLMRFDVITTTISGELSLHAIV